MNRVTKRSWLMGAFILLLLGGMGFFVVEYVFQADTWVVSTGSPHVYKGSNLGNGTVVDRNDVVLLDIDENRTYSDNAQTRAATLHWLGDRATTPPLWQAMIRLTACIILPGRGAWST